MLIVQLQVVPLRDGDVYACNLVCGCQRVSGREVFEPKQMKNLNARGGKLWCKERTDAKKKGGTRLEQQDALNEAERKGVHERGLKCARLECAKEHFDFTRSARGLHTHTEM